MERIRWASKVQPDRIRRLYESDAKGLLDERLLDDVAYAFYARCRSIVMVTEGRGLCPDCETEYRMNAPCEGCGRVITSDEFRASYRHQDLYGGSGIEYFQSYVDLFPSAKDTKERLLLVDQLLHAFHRGVLPTAQRSLANNLIEGSQSQVGALLDALTFGKDSTAGGYKTVWKEPRDAMMLLRRAKDRDGD